MDTFESFLKKGKTGSEVKDIKSYLLGIAKNLCMAHFKKAKRNQSLEDSLSNFMEIEVEDQHDSDELMNRLMSSLYKLSDDQRRCIELFFLKELSYNKVADKLNMTYNEVKSFIQNGKRNLKNLMIKTDS